MKEIEKIILCWIIPCFLIVGCAKDSSQPSIIPPPPKSTESVLPTMHIVDSGIDNTIKENIKFDQKLKEQRQIVLDQKIAISEALSQAEKIHDMVLANDTIKEIDAVNLITQLKKVEARNLFLETKNIELVTVKDDQEKLLKNLKVVSNDALQKLTAKENEASELRSQNDYLGKNLNNKNQEVETLKKLLEKEKIKSATSGVYRNWIIGLVSGFILWTIIKNIMMIYFPIKFRI